MHRHGITRRRFLAGSLGAASWLCAGRLTAAPPSTDPNRWVLVSDTHIWEHRDQKHRDANPAENFVRVRGEILALKRRPAGVIVSGDLVYLQGHAADYAVLADLVQPLRQAGIPLHFLLGNHDNRENFWKAFPDAAPGKNPAVPGKHVAIVPAAHANWFLLDSLERTNVTAGRLGQAQLEWLAKELDARPDRPAVVVAHHPRDRAEAVKKAVERTSLLQSKTLRKRLDQVAAVTRAASVDSVDLRDTNELFEVLIPRRQVKAYVFGRTHRWEISKYRGIHLVNLPTTAWTFAAKEVQGWVDATLRPNGITLTFNALDKRHKNHGQKVDLTWRD